MECNFFIFTNFMNVKNNTRKILIISTDFSPSQGGGICTHTKFIVDGLINLGWEFVILSEYYLPTPDEKIEEFIKNYQSPVYRLFPAPSLLKLLKKCIYCYKIAKKHKVDIILGTGRHPVWLAAFVSLLYRKPLVTIGHGTEFIQKTSKYDFFFNRISYGKSDLLISISEYTKKIVFDMGIRPKKIAVIYNSADSNVFKCYTNEIINSFKDKKNIQNRKILVTVGSISERKGQKVVINALPKVIQTIPDILYVAIGIFNNPKEYIELLNETGTIGHVLFTGKVEEHELVLWLNAADCFIMTSRTNMGDFEGYGIAVVEAALCGKASIISDNAGLKESVIDGETGIIVKENCPEDTANAIIKLLSDEALIKAMSNNALNYALKNNTWIVKAKEYDQHISVLLSTNFCSVKE